MKAVKNSHQLALAVSWLCTLLIGVPAYGSGDESSSHKPLGLELQAGVGYRTGDLQWDIASDITGTATPNVLSELTYSDVKYEEFITSGVVRFHHGPFAGVELSGLFVAGEASEGTNRDSDYNGDNRTLEYSRSRSDADGSELTVVELGIAYRFKLSERLSLAPKFAYSYNEQHMRMTNGVQELDTRAVALSLGPFSGNLNSTYTAEWEGIIAGGDVTWQTQKHSLMVELQFHFQDYYAEANWNLREDFAHPVSFAHWAKGDGTRWKIQYRYQFSTYFALWLQGSAEQFETEPGRDVVYFADGTNGATRLNGVSWESSGYALGIEFNL